jgi:DNA ligase 1
MDLKGMLIIWLNMVKKFIFKAPILYMRYSVLADVYEKLSDTAGKLEKTHIIAELLRKTPEDILYEIVLLLNGSVFPSWGDGELGVANQMMLGAISKALGIEQERISKEFNKLGDLGLVVESFSKSKKQTTLGSRELDVTKVFENLKKIALQTGGGSQDRKTDLIAELLIQAKPKEAKYIVRTTIGQLRIGVAEGLLRDAIAEAFEISPESVENAWFIDPDYGEIAKLAKIGGEKALEKVKMQLGRPIMVQLAEKAPSLEEALNSFNKVALEYKYDGARMLIHKKGDHIEIFTRRLENITKAFPDIVKVCKSNIRATSCIVDGEGVAIDPKTGKPLAFQMLSQRIKRKYDVDETAIGIPIELNLFDIILLNDKNLTDLPLEERRKMLSTVVKEISGKIQMANQLVTKDMKEADAFYKKSLKEGHEGLIVKDLEAKYQPGKRVAGGWLKVKPVLESLDLVITGATWGTGKRAGWLGSFILACRDPNTGAFLECGMLGSGVKEKKTEEDDVTLKELTKELKPLIEFEKGNEVKIKPKLVLEVSYEEIQKSPTYSSGYALRFPRLIKMRWDKGIDEADDLGRLERIYKSQKGKR